MSTSNSSGGGIGFFGLLTIVFVTLKLTGFIDWSWWWVLAPTLWPIALLLVLLIVWGGFIFIAWLIESSGK